MFIRVVHMSAALAECVAMIGISALIIGITFYVLYPVFTRAPSILQ